MNLTRPHLFLICAAYSTHSFAEGAASSPIATYQMDLFSIISFALSIAGFVISIFLGWLSWEFYKQSSATSEKSQEAVTKIETAVLGIQSDITEIVRQAVGQWTGNGSAQETSETSALNGKFEELAAQIKLVSGSAANKEEMEAKLAEVIQMQREQIANLTASANEAKARALFPSIADRGPVSEVTHTVTSSNGDVRTGQLVINVLRPSKVVTATVAFEPPINWPPTIEAKVVNEQGLMPNFLKVTCGLGSEQHFNIHLMHQGGGLLAPATVQPGTYVVEYATKNGIPIN